MENNTLRIKGKFIKALNLMQGTGKTGNEWKKQDFIIETDGDYPKQVAFSVFNDKVDEVNAFAAGDKLTVFFNPESREYNGKCYTDLRAWKIVVGYGKTQTQTASTGDDLTDDLPF